VQGKAATVDQIKAILTNPQNGIKAEELKWTGVMQEVERLAKENNGKVPKDALLRYLAEDGAVRLEEARGLSTDRDIARNADGSLRADQRPDFAPKYGSYQLPGGENYREVVLAMPPIGGGQVVPHPEGRGFAIQYKDGSYEGGNTPTRWDSRGAAETTGMSFYKNAGGYTSTHFDTPNYVAHMRLNERVDAKGKQGLFIEELQSDRHQAGREHGYKEPFEQWIAYYDAGGTEVPIGYGRSEKQALDSIDKNWEGLVKIQTRKRDGVEGVIPDAPFRTSWPLQLFKRALRDAVADGKEWIGWTDGVTQVDRYTEALRQRVKSIEWTREDGLTVVDVQPQQGKRIYLPVKDGKIYRTADQQSLVGKDLSEVIGKEASAKVNEAASGKLTGENLTIGGEGMKGFYDNMVPKEVAKYVKQWGAQVEKDGIKTKVSEAESARRYEVSKEPEGYSIRETVTGELYKDQTGRELYFSRRNSATLKIGELHRSLRETKTIPIWRVNITPQMREGIKKAGQALFVGGAAAVVAEDQLEQ
jgi:hypothetical protein